MFGIFQADLPIGRTVWLVTLTLIATDLALRQSVNFSNDPAAFAIALVIYTGHSIVFGFLYSFLLDVATIVVDTYLLLRRSVSWRKTAIPFENLSYDCVREVLSNLGIVSAAALAAPYFRHPSLTKCGLIGVALILIGERVLI